jgi:hypothetical protein
MGCFEMKRAVVVTGPSCFLFRKSGLKSISKIIKTTSCQINYNLRQRLVSSVQTLRLKSTALAVQGIPAIAVRLQLACNRPRRRTQQNPHFYRWMKVTF